MSKDEINKKKSANIFSAFKRFTWPRRKVLFIGLIFITINRLLAIVIPWKSKTLVDEVIPNKDVEGLYALLVIVFGSLLIQGITTFSLTRILGVQSHELIFKLRTKLQEKVLSMPTGFFDSNKSGALVSRIMNDVTGLRYLIGTGLVQLVGAVITALVSIVLLIQISPVMTLTAFLPVSVFAILALKVFKYVRPVYKNDRKIIADVSGRLIETLSGVKVIKGFNAEKQETDNFKKGAEQIFMNKKKILTTQATLDGISIVLLGLATVAMMGVGAHQIISGNMTIGDFLFFSLLLAFMISPVKQLSQLGGLLTEALAGLDRTDELMKNNSEEEIDQRHLVLDKLNGDIAFKNVSFFYEEDKKVLHDINFDVKAGSVIALVGSSGSGKSTVAALSASFLKPQSGTITVDGKDLSKVKLSSFRKHLGVVLQDDFLFEGTIKENILFPKPEASEEQLQMAVKAGYVDEFTDRFEDGLDTMIGERGVKLSGGQRQRINIARAILADPKILILDEATSNLDTQSELLIQKSLSALVRNRTSIVIAHRLSTIKKADQILVIEAGRILEQGTHDQLIEKEGRYYELYTYQAKI
ncbi:MAG: ABC transporter ATP-binding protein [Bacteroidota bacterium]